MLDQDIQSALSKLDQSSKATRHKRYALFGLVGFVFLLAAIGGSVYQKKQVPEVTAEHLSRLIVIASRTSNNDPVRLLGDVERYMGKRMRSLSDKERMAALSFLIGHIELNHNKQELITY